jgi:hypothetical protein
MQGKGDDMNKITLVLLFSYVFLITGCEKKAQTEQSDSLRTMIIGGVPAHDKDFQVQNTHHE